MPKLKEYNTTLNEHTSPCVLLFFISLHLDGSKHSPFSMYVFAGDVMSIPHMYYICPFSRNLVRTQLQCVCVSCALQSSQYAALGSSLQLLQPWVGVSSLPPAQFSWQQKRRRTFKCARGSADCRGLSRRGEHRGRHAAMPLQHLCGNRLQVRWAQAVKDALNSSAMPSTCADEINTHRPEWQERFSSLFAVGNDEPVIKSVIKSYNSKVEFKWSGTSVAKFGPPVTESSSCFPLR